MNTITDEEYEELKEYIKLYKEIRPIVHNGIMYRIESAFDKPYSAYLYVYDDNAVLFAFSACMQFAATPENFRLCGLEKDAKYDVGEYGIRSGSGLMNVGLQIKLRGDMDCKNHKNNKNKNNSAPFTGSVCKMQTFTLRFYYFFHITNCLFLFAKDTYSQMLIFLC
ncbi:MAG: GH36 C-terminal domain-containing protein [Clostridiales bacterium]|nr:MAG: GH36 C-terminal domain-containing protein [Clostridiales bacterium]